MRIEPYKDWIIRTIPMNVVLCKSAGFVKLKDANGKETGELAETFKDESNHASVPQALRALCRKELNASKAESFKEFKKECDKLEKLLLRIEAELKDGVFIGEDDGNRYVLYDTVRMLEEKVAQLEKQLMKKKVKEDKKNEQCSANREADERPRTEVHSRKSKRGGDVHAGGGQADVEGKDGGLHKDNDVRKTS